MDTDEHRWKRGLGRRSAVACLLVAVALASAAERKEKPWERPYSGEEATGDAVLALWQFDQGAETTDASGKGRDLKLRGQSRIAKDGRFGSCLECFAAPEDKPEGAQVMKLDTALSPKGAFTAELWLKPKPEMADLRTAWLLDCKYFNYAKDIPQANTGYLLLLQRSGEKWRPTVMLGFGKDSESYQAKPVELAAGAWRHLAFTYDGEGTVRILLDGKDIGGGTTAGRGAIEPTRYALTVGGRYGSIHHGTPAFFDQVRIARGITMRSLAVTIATADGRTAFYRMERASPLLVTLTNNTGRTLTDGVCRIAFGGDREVSLPHLPPKGTCVVEVPVDTSLRPDSYELKVAVAAKGDGKAFEAEETAAVVIVPRPLPNQMPVVMWGGGDFETLKDIGFTHQLVHLADYQKVWDAGRPLRPDEVSALDTRREMLNRHLAEGVGAALTVAPGRFAAKQEGFQRINRAGKPYEQTDVCALNPRVRAFSYNVGATIANAFGHFPALQAALIHSEVRGHTNVCWHDYDKAAFREATGADIPRIVSTKSVGHYSGITGFPKNRIVPDDDPILTFYRWFWERGDGWNGLHTRVHDGLKSTGRDDLWTWYDPAVRVPSKWGSGGGVDILSQWTYCYPDPIKIGQATDELFAMAAGRPGQQVMKMTQIIWYRRQTAPELPKDESRKAQWEKDIPDARFVTIAPDHMREAFWSKISRPIRGIMYHGWGSLVPAKHGSYRFTNPETRGVLTQLIRDVVRPLGPTLLQVPDREADVAILESFASQVYAQRGTWGWSHTWEADVHLVCQWAQLQPRILYEEHILRDGLDGIRVLVMPCCDVLPESVYRKIADFQRRGGILVADEHLAPALDPDILIMSRKRSGKADEDKAALHGMAAMLRQELDTVYQRYGESDNPDVVVRFRRYRDTDYLFALNDKRTFGDYVGHHGRVMEKGLPATATLLIRRPNGHVYDLVRHEAVEAETTEDGLRLKADFGPTEGKLLMIAERPITGLRVLAPRRARLGGRVRIHIAVLSGLRPIRAVVPLRVEILDPQGRPAEGTGYYGALEGRQTVTLDLAANDLPGEWTLLVQELASGLRDQRTLIVR